MNNLLYTLPFLISLLFFIILISPLKVLAERYAFLPDAPDNKRKMHSHPVPRIGGIALFLSIILSYFYYCYYYRLELFFKWGVVIGFVIIFMFGLMDDQFFLSPGFKLIGQIMAGFFAVFYGGVRIVSLGEFWPGKEISLGYFSIPFTIFIIIGIINAVNMSDGLDGLTGGICTLSFFCVLILSHEIGNNSIILISVCILGAIFGFLRYNTYPAVIFLGDSGSQLLGFCLSIVTIIITQQESIFSPFLFFIILGFPLLDVVAVFWERIRQGKSPFLADRNHFHHKLMKKGINHRGSVIIIYVIQTFFILLAFLLRYQTNIFIFWSYFISIMVIITLYLMIDLVFSRNIFIYSSFFHLFFKNRKMRLIDRTDIAHFALNCLTILITFFYIISPFLIRNISGFIFTCTLIFFGLIFFFLLFGKRNKDPIIKLGSYFIGATSLYFLESSHYFFSKNIVKYYNLYFILIIGFFFLFVAGTIKPLPLISLDYFVFFFLIIVPHLPLSSINGLNLGPFLLKLFTLFYSLELIEFKKGIVIVQFSTIIALGLISCNYILINVLN